MESNWYEQECEKMEAPITSNLEASLVHNARLVHAAFGLSSEVGELIDQLKRHVYYGTSLDNVNILEEVGDILWYLTLVCNVMGITLEEAKQTNVKKLQKRYGTDGQFSQDRALNRDLNKERSVLEKRGEEFAETKVYCKKCGSYAIDKNCCLTCGFAFN